MHPEVAGEDYKRNLEKDRKEALREWVRDRLDDFIAGIADDLSLYHGELVISRERNEELKQEAAMLIKELLPKDPIKKKKEGESIGI